MNTYVTSYGVIKLGPEFSFALLSAEMDVRELRGKRRTEAKARLERYEACINTLAEIKWRAGDVLEQLP